MAMIKYYVSTMDTFDIVVGIGLIFASAIPTAMVVCRFLHIL